MIPSYLGMIGYSHDLDIDVTSGLRFQPLEMILFNFPWWDRFFGTYRPEPAAGHEAMIIGNAHFRDARVPTLWKLLLLPFRRGGMPSQIRKKRPGPDSEGGR
jgi:hypothetical protein